MKIRYTIYRMDLEDGSTKVIKTVDTAEEAARKVASFKRIVAHLSSKATEDFRYFYKPNEQV